MPECIVTKCSFNLPHFISNLLNYHMSDFVQVKIELSVYEFLNLEQLLSVRNQSLDYFFIKLLLFLSIDVL